jgi:hypothetical protein
MGSRTTADDRLLERYVTEEEHAELLREIEQHRPALRRTQGAAGLGPRYSVISGDVIAASLPRVRALAEKVRAEIEAFGGVPVRLFADPIRCMRVQCYEDIEEGFRWHFDGHSFAAVVTLLNESEGVTELLGPRVSALIRPFFYLAYPWPGLFSLLPRRSIAAKARDVLLLRGRRILHRGRSSRAGLRTILVFAYTEPDAKPSRIANWFARKVNY